MDKTTLRNKMRQALATMTDEAYQYQSLAIVKKVLQESYIIEANIIGMTISNKPEVDTILLIEELWRLGKKVAVPKCHPKTRAMSFYIIDSFAQLETVYMHLREPIPARCELVDANDMDVILVPGVVFDRNGYRIGYGGGYYDRYVLNYKKGKLMSLLFDEQIIDCVPAEEHDCPVDIIMTPTERIDCLAQRGASENG
ncbi:MULTISPECIES: 5-formyltetrahydrofolate cyclo-ligase [Lysinibacillus]|jgi:5-formyltetrahydrofolate cyclo-ligase|uniref:5-formyltetrahydrofolate cyclo-ligase n=1 Tax=Lysinibacillus TaxID=400634 RepID=UPI00056948F8|nr:MULTISPECIES: 5-formyltetrahydrofolate cyclo-ligase [Lysinibacillus]MEE3805979.1 5-formyltetrahydrofolate cyclo-ligase [Lysinibacillus fusiformis]WCH46264.1 5-formyltetrahydrofolate cyclo-ligase [Lysinibacillus sp. OF-1]SCZ09260.1 5-formyltetrahydrofolate cyclo-ligase [Lysinibacillus sp. SG9]SDB54289.1 5-formyltetrahydrofolate cyclo-ligase [Lysinibacillus sp. TC-37]SFT18291.1 5-formyltetrahydrofolate cyclo-ligase [Lysinibacillus sp. SG55]